MGRRKEVFDGLRNIYEEEASIAFKARYAKFKEEMALDERLIDMQQLQSKHESLADFLKMAIESFIEREFYTAGNKRQSYLGWNASNDVKAKLAIMSRAELAKYTIEELASLLRPYKLEDL